MGSNFSPTSAPCLFLAVQSAGLALRLKSSIAAYADLRAARRASGSRLPASATSRPATRNSPGLILAPSKRSA